MKEKVQNAIKTVVCLALIVGMIIRLGYLVRPTECDRIINAKRTFLSMPEDSFEVIAYGSSHVWHCLDVMEMYEIYGIGAFNYGSNWESINTTALYLEDSFRTQSPKVVLIETFNVNRIRKNLDMNGEIYCTRELPESEAKQKYLQCCFGDNKERWLSYYVPFCAFHGNWDNLDTKSFRLPDEDSFDFYKTMGFYPNDKVVPISISDPSTFEELELNEEAIAILDEIVQVCEDNGAKIVFYTIPYEGHYGYGDAMEEYARENGCDYINLFEHVEDVGLNGETDYYDIDHLNTSGSTKVARYLGAYLVENYDLTDMRTIDGNIWEQALSLE